MTLLMYNSEAQEKFMCFVAEGAVWGNKSFRALESNQTHCLFLLHFTDSSFSHFNRIVYISLWLRIAETFSLSWKSIQLKTVLLAYCPSCSLLPCWPNLGLWPSVFLRLGSDHKQATGLLSLTILTQMWKDRQFLVLFSETVNLKKEAGLDWGVEIKILQLERLGLKCLLDIFVYGFHGRCGFGFGNH